jgi:hypothetical protein
MKGHDVWRNKLHIVVGVGTNSKVLSCIHWHKIKQNNQALLDA